MGGGSWNGKNFGGMHTGADKKQNGGPYHNNGYRPEPNVSHLDFMEGEKVIYTGSEKYKHKSRVPNGSIGTVMKKDNLSNKRQKTCRSILKVNFGLYGINFIRKELLQRPSDYSECLEEQLDKMDNNEGIQDYRNEQKKTVQDKFHEKNYGRILENRAKNKKFRDWRKVFLDEKKLELEGKAHEIKLSDEYKSKRKHQKKVREEVDELKEKESNEDKYHLEFIQQHKDSDLDNDAITKMYNVQKNKNTRQLKFLRIELNRIENYFDKSSKEYKELNKCIHDGSRKFIREVNSKHDYNNYLQHHYGQKDKDDKVDYKYKIVKPSREYKVDSDTPAVESYEINLLQWGLYPHDVAVH